MSNDVIQISVATLAVCTICNIAVLFLYSTNTETRKNVLHKLTRTPSYFHIYATGVLFYIDGIYMAKRFSIFPYLFPLAVIWYIFTDLSASSPTQRDADTLNRYVTALILSNHTLFVFAEGLQRHMFD